MIDRDYLFKFLRENLKIDVWCDYDGCGSPQVTVSLDLCGEEIDRSSAYLLKVH